MNHPTTTNKKSGYESPYFVAVRTATRSRGFVDQRFDSIEALHIYCHLQIQTRKIIKFKAKKTIR